MGFFDRIEKIVDAAVDLSTARVNTVLDIVTAPFTDDEYEGFTDTVRGIANQYVSDEMVHTLGPGAASRLLSVVCQNSWFVSLSATRLRCWKPVGARVYRSL